MPFLHTFNHTLFRLSIWKQKCISSFYSRLSWQFFLTLRQTIVQGSPTMRSMFPPLVGLGSPTMRSMFPPLVGLGSPTMRSMFPPLVGLKSFYDMKNLSGLIYNRSQSTGQPVYVSIDDTTCVKTKPSSQG